MSVNDEPVKFKRAPLSISSAYVIISDVSSAVYTTSLSDELTAIR